MQLSHAASVLILMMNDLIGKEIVGRYRIDSLVRETEIGDFYRGTNLVAGGPVTIKILAPAMAIDQRYVDRFLAEANASADVSHPNILNILDIGTDTHILPFAIFEPLEGKTLRELIRSEGQLAQPRAIAIAKQVASALSAAHTNNMVHGGLNPDKIFVQTNGRVDIVKVFDFGVRAHAANSLDAVAYLAPEQTRDIPSTDARSDIYAVGTIVYEMAAGETPFFGTTPSEVIRKQLNDLPPPLAAFRQDLHPQVEPIILSAIVADPERRYQLMSDVEEDLGRLASETGAVLTPVPAIPPIDAAAKRNIWQTAFIVLAGVALLSAALIYATSTKQTNPTVSTVPDADSSPVQPINPATGAQEEAMLKLGDIGDVSLLPNSNTQLPAGTLPGGDGYNAWANGGVPPAGAPLSSGPLAGAQNLNQPPAISVPPGGQTVTINPNGGSVFMPNDGGVILVPIPANAVPPKPTPTPKTATNTSTKPPVDPKATPTPKTPVTKAENPKTNGKPGQKPPGEPE